MIPLEDMKEHPPIAVCVPSTTLTRYVLFELSLSGSHVPPLSSEYRIVSTSPAKNRNDAIRMAPLEVTHFFFIDDDQHFDADLIRRLLAWRVPVVCPLVPLARPPFFPILFKGETVIDAQPWDEIALEIQALAARCQLPEAEARLRHTLHLEIGALATKLGRKRYENISWAELDRKRGLYPVFAGPGSGILVERAVLDQMPKPWFEVGRYDPEQLQEDVVFYEKCRNLGVPVYCDLDSPMGHIAPTVVWPVRTDDDRWTIELMWENGQKFKMGRSDGAGWPGGKAPRPAREVVPQ